MAIAIGVVLAVLVLAVAALIMRTPRRSGTQVAARQERPARPVAPRTPTPLAPPRARTSAASVPVREVPAARSAPSAPATPAPAAIARTAVPPPAATGRPAATPAAAVARPTATSAAAARRPQARTAGGPTVLIVDDSAIMRRTLDVLFSKAGYHTACVEDGSRAVTWVGQHGLPALVTLDMEMPGLNGLETLRSLHAATGGGSVPAVFVTTRSHERVRETATQLGALAFFSKPFNTEDLLALARRVAPVPVAG